MSQQRMQVVSPRSASACSRKEEEDEEDSLGNSFLGSIYHSAVKMAGQGRLRRCGGGAEARLPNVAVLDNSGCLDSSQQARHAASCLPSSW